MQKKSDKLEIRIEPELKEEFFETCRERMINPSELLRREIKKIILYERGGWRLKKILSK